MSFNARIYAGPDKKDVVKGQQRFFYIAKNEGGEVEKKKMTILSVEERKDGGLFILGTLSNSSGGAVSVEAIYYPNLCKEPDPGQEGRGTINSLDD